MPLSRSPNDLTTPERSGHWGAALLHAEIYLGSAPAVARFDEGFLSAGIRYFHNGHLSLRVTADSNGTKVGEQGHFPFGEDWYLSGAVAKYRFTGYERDSESGNDYALARYHINRLGRFSSPDRIAGSIGDPQSLNRYAYVRNDPVNLTDPSGQLAAAWETFFNWLLGIGCTWEDILEGRACSGDPAGGGGDPGSEPEIDGGGGVGTSNLRLVATRDCTTSKGRVIDYRLETTTGTPVTTPNYYVVQHESNPNRVGKSEFGPQTSFGEYNQFHDSLMPGSQQIFYGPDNSIQTFFIAPMSKPKSPENMQPVLVRDSQGQDFSELGAWMSTSQILVNGKPSPSMAPCR